MTSVFMRFPEGKLKAVTFSYDDGVIQDRRLVPLLDQYGLKATFNLNSEWFGKSHIMKDMGIEFEHIKVEEEEVRKLYANHEVAVHTLTHPLLTKKPDEEVIRQVEQDRLNLSKLVGYEVIGMAYPCGGKNHDERTERLIREHTGVKYCRTIECSGSFDLQQDLYKFQPSAHHLEADGKTYEICKQFVEMKTEKPQLLYIWGHSYEMDFGDRWDELEEIFKLVSNRDDIFYGTNREVFGGMYTYYARNK